MIKYIKEVVSHLFGFIVLFLPTPVGSGIEFRTWSIAAIAVGAIIAFAAFYYKGIAWIRAQIRTDNKPLIISCVLLLICLAIYLGLYINIDTPSQFVRNIEMLTYCVSAFLLSIPLSLVAAIVNERTRKK